MVTEVKTNGNQYSVRNVRMGVPNARKTDRSELRNTLEGTEHGKGAEVWNKVRKKGEMQNVYRRGERLGLSSRKYGT